MGEFLLVKGKLQKRLQLKRKLQPSLMVCMMSPVDEGIPFLRIKTAGIGTRFWGWWIVLAAEKDQRQICK